jgi:hypothetical protein
MRRPGSHRKDRPLWASGVIALVVAVAIRLALGESRRDAIIIGVCVAIGGTYGIAMRQRRDQRRDALGD